MALRRTQEVWKEVSVAIIKNCFAKCGIVKNDDLMEAGEEKLREFEALVRELRSDILAAEYINLDTDIPASEPMINDHKIDW